MPENLEQSNDLSPPARRNFFDSLTLLLATGFGLGWVPFAPGTFGSLWGLVVGWGLDSLPVGGKLAVAAAAFVVGIPICEKACRLIGRDDPGAVVFDEIAAFPVVFLLVPFNGTTAVIGFLLFRLFDVTKPWPIRKLERLPGGLGIMADDLLAGVYAGALLWCVARWGL